MKEPNEALAPEAPPGTPEANLSGPAKPEKSPLLREVRSLAVRLAVFAAVLWVLLTQLYLVSREEILDVLGPLSKSARPKPNRKGQPRRIYAPEFKAEAMQRLRSGESFRRVAEDMGVNVRTMATWAYQMRRKEREKNAKL